MADNYSMSKKAVNRLRKEGYSKKSTGPTYKEYHDYMSKLNENERSGKATVREARSKKEYGSRKTVDTGDVPLSHIGYTYYRDKFPKTTKRATKRKAKRS